MFSNSELKTKKWSSLILGTRYAFTLQSLQKRIPSQSKVVVQSPSIKMSGLVNKNNWTNQPPQRHHRKQRQLVKKIGEFPKNIRANNIKTKLVSNNKNETSFTKHENKIVYENVLLVKIIHNSKHSLEKVWKLQIKFCEFDCLTGYSVLFLCYSKQISFLGYLKLILFLCYLLLCYLVRNQKIVPGFK